MSTLIPIERVRRGINKALILPVGGIEREKRQRKRKLTESTK